MEIKDIISNLPKHPTAQYKTRPPEIISEIIIHHSATKKGTPFSFARYHIDTRDFPGIGYHFVIPKDGTIFQTNELSKISWHCSGRNTVSVGICLIGHFDNEKPTIEQLQSLQKLITYLKEHLPTINKISGHRNYSTKTCPGELLHERVYLKMFEGGVVAPPEFKPEPEPVKIVKPEKIETLPEVEPPKNKLPLILRLIFGFLDSFVPRKKN